ncbi:large ribosomal subunit protein uL16m-like [Tubulanus polymorphus]|uniref:large ribosomal subunit protein uL16m-like n=1 Tax=Tubulanus polymorphus TaxID=672921 RepID=UPI003DA1D5D6
MMMSSIIRRPLAVCSRRNIDSIQRKLLEIPRCATTVSCATLMNLKPPVKFDHVEFPERRRLKILEKVPQYPATMRVPKMSKRLIDMRGPELVHNKLIHKQYAIIALTGGKLRHGHLELIRLTINRNLDEKRMFAVWRVDAPWKPITKKGQGHRMGGGKGSIDHYVTPVKAGRVIIEVGGHAEFEEVEDWMSMVALKLPFNAEVVSQEILDERDGELERIERQNLNPFTFEHLLKTNSHGCHFWASRYDFEWKGKFR